MMLEGFSPWLRSRGRFALGFVVFINLVVAIGRLGFAISGFNGGIEKFLDVPVLEVTAIFLHAMFLSLGLIGLVATAGLALGRVWGFRLVAYMSAATIFFDLYGVTIQGSAAMGFIAPTVTLIYLGLRSWMRGQEHMGIATRPASTS